jgi:hypothetical protein
MAIDHLYFQVMTQALAIAKSGESPESKVRVGCLSYPDLLVTRDQILQVYPDLEEARFMLRDDFEKVRSWHGMDHLSEIIDTSDFFKKINCTVDYFDFQKFRGGEIICDLNHPLEARHHGSYDFVIDTGTLEHCFNVGVAFENMCRLAKIGGIIVSAAPMTKINHGFWNFSPCVYENYFRQNNFKIMFFAGFYKGGGGISKFEVSPSSRQTVPPESLLVCVARRTEESTFDLPIQQKYLQTRS